MHAKSHRAYIYNQKMSQTPSGRDKKQIFLCTVIEGVVHAWGSGRLLHFQRESRICQTQACTTLHQKLLV
jgi:hypothetical protein